MDSKALALRLLNNYLFMSSFLDSIEIEKKISFNYRYFISYKLKLASVRQLKSTRCNYSCNEMQETREKFTLDKYKVN